MRLIHKLTLALASVSLPLAVVSVGVTLFIQAEIQELGNFHTPNLYYIQTIASETLGAIEESFAYLASGDTKEKEHFLAWARKFPARMGEFETSAALGHDEEDTDTLIYRKIMADYHALLENADAMFREYEFAGKLSEPFYGRYEDAVNRLRAGVEELVRYEKTEVDHAQAEALHVIQRSREAVIFLALLSVVLALLAGFVLSRAISGPVSRLRSASAEISRGEFDVEIPTQSKDEIGDLGRSISQMAQELKKRHEELEESNAVLARQAAELETANKTQADFMAMIVHDLRAPMSNVVGVATMMEDGYMGSLTDEQRKWIGKIKSNTDNLVALVNDYLDVSKLEAGRIDLSRGQVDLNVLLRNTIENFAPLATDKRISLTSGTDVSLPAIQADARRLEQVLNNLLSNALKFTPEGGEIELGASADGAEAKIWVKDTGVGIASEELGRVFEKYRQSASGKISNHKGTGLGLVICKMIVEAHGGKIWGESEEGEGTKFTFTMPLDQGKNRSVGEKIEESCADA